MKSAITINTKGDFKKLTSFVERLKSLFSADILNKYGRLGVEALKNNTPKDSGETSESWKYKIIRAKNSATIEFHNTNIQNGYNVAIILYTGHATKNGYWIDGVDYINPALRPILEELAKNAIKEATK